MTRYSASLIKVYKSCPFRFYCKITDQEKDTNVDTSYGDAGNAVHHTLEYYFEHLYDIPLDSALVELKNHFEEKWESYELTNPVLKKDLYWLCVINGIKLDVKPTHLEHEFRIIEEGIDFIGYADVMNTEEHWIGDWKTSTYKKNKLDGYKEQLKFYAWAYWKEQGVIPMCWVYFNKVNKIFKYQFPLETIQNVEIELKQIALMEKKRMVDLDFERKPSRNNCYFCPWKGVCSTDLLRGEEAEKYEIKFHLKKNKILIEGAIPDIIHRKIEKGINFELKNAFFIIKAMAQRGVKVDGIKRLYHRRAYGGETFIGYTSHVYQVLKEYAHSKGMKIRVSIQDYRTQDVLENKIKTLPKLNTPFELYDFQVKAVDELMKARWGIIEIGTGGGKTVIAAEAIRQLGLKTLFIIDNKDLLMQTKKEYETMLGIQCGVVGMGYRDWDKPVVLATIQTLAKHAKSFVTELAMFPAVIYDETHIIASKSFETVSKFLVNTKYRFGFSATAKRDDGNDNIIYAHTGSVVYRRRAQELIKDNVLVEPEATFYNYGSKIVVSDNWQNEYADGIVDNELRNGIIKKIAEEYLAAGKQVMILTKMIRHGEHFKNCIKGADLIYGKTDDDLRVDILDDFKTGKLKCLIGNMKIFNKGINIKNLDVLINAAGNAGDVVTIQTIGRILRKNPGKEKAYYADFMDAGEYLHKHSMSRIAALKAEDYNVTVKDLA